jgi:L-alanine-DL-glutamate epimerase-like enolase superfamily enzyme
MALITLTSPRIVNITATPVSIPFAYPERWAFGEHRGMTSIIVQIETDTGVVGLGEVVPGGPGPKTLVAAIEEASTLLIGRSAIDIEANTRRLMYVGGWYMFARTGNLVIAGLETAMWDILGQTLGQPLFRIFGGAVRESVEYVYYLQRRPDIEELLEEARNAIGEGFRTIWLKGGDNEAADLEVVARLRETLGAEPRIRLDANEAWTVGTALRMLVRLEPFDLEFVEQPVRLDDLDALVRLRQSTRVPIGVNQSGWTGQRILDVITRRAADVIVTDPHQEGGLSAFRRVVGMCEIAGLPVAHHAFSGLTIAMTASLHVLCSSANCILGNQAYAPGFLEADVTDVEFDITGGTAKPSDRPGLGVSIDPVKLKTAADRFRDEGFYPFFDAGSSPSWVPMR